MRIPSILVVSTERNGFSDGYIIRPVSTSMHLRNGQIGYGCNGLFGLKYSTRRKDATVFSSRAAAVHACEIEYRVVPASATKADIRRELWGTR